MMYVTYTFAMAVAHSLFTCVQITTGFTIHHNILRAKYSYQIDGKKRYSVVLPVADKDSFIEYPAVSAEDIAGRLAGAENQTNGAGGVFYNRLAAIGRDLSVLMASILVEERMRKLRLEKFKPDLNEGRHHSAGTARMDPSVDWRELAAETRDEHGLVILDAFAASGVRALR